MLAFESLKVGETLYRYLGNGKHYTYKITSLHPISKVAICEYTLGDSKIVGPVSKHILQELYRIARKPDLC